MTTTPLMTTDELLALPEDGVERELIRGVLREKPMILRSRRHARTAANVAAILSGWLRSRPESRGEVLAGGAGVCIRRNPDTTLIIDIAYISAETAAANPEDAAVINGVPVLAVEVLCFSDTQEEIIEKLREYLDAGVSRVWVLEPVFRTLSVYRPDAEPVLLNALQELSGNDQLPGLRVRVAELFGG